MEKNRGGGGGPAPFLVKTHRMVEDDGTDGAISSGEKGTSFVVWKPAEFAGDLLPVHFKHNDFSSFVRQLNTYGSRKVVPDRWEFASENFRRGDERLLRVIRRRKANADHHDNKKKKKKQQHPPPLPPSISGDQSQALSSSINASASSSSSPRPPPSYDPALMAENENLRKDHQLLTAELASAKRRYLELVAALSDVADGGEKLDSIKVLMQKAGENDVAGEEKNKTEAGMEEEKKVEDMELSFLGC